MFKNKPTLLIFIGNFFKCFQSTYGPSISKNAWCFERIPWPGEPPILPVISGVSAWLLRVYRARQFIATFPAGWSPQMVVK